ncbi:hypothetical protein V6N12_074919 [Hibiscus sabdariffa]|uniref:Uncharacterized protein n=1 Tax=Hibiscus sabdariffa TaxID=183260 RepID=A0ABR2D3K4_9ROSI
MEDQRFSKQGRSDNRNMIGLDENMFMDFESEERVNSRMNPVDMNGKTDSGVQGISPKASYASMVTGKTASNSNYDDIPDLTPDKVIVRDEDYIIHKSGEYPTIAFSNHGYCPRNEKVVSDKTTTEKEVVIDKANNTEVGEGLYGPWMVVDNRRRRSTNSGRGTSGKRLDHIGANGSRFSALNESDMEYVQDDSVERNTTEPVSVIHKTSLSPGTTSDPAAVRHTEIINSTAYVASNPSRKSKGNKDNERQAQAFPVVPVNSIKVIEHQPTGKLSEHRAVSILEQDQEINIREGSQNGNNRVFRVKVVKENIKMGLAIRKQSNSKTISRPVLSEWVDTVNNQLDSIAFQKEIDPGGVSKVVVRNGGSLELVQASDRHQLPGGLAMDPVEVSDDVNEPMVS